MHEFLMKILAILLNNPILLDVGEET